MESLDIVSGRGIHLPEVPTGGLGNFRAQTLLTPKSGHSEFRSTPCTKKPQAHFRNGRPPQNQRKPPQLVEKQLWTGSKSTPIVDGRLKMSERSPKPMSGMDGRLKISENPKSPQITQNRRFPALLKIHPNRGRPPQNQRTPPQLVAEHLKKSARSREGGQMGHRQGLLYAAPVLHHNGEHPHDDGLRIALILGGLTNITSIWLRPRERIKYIVQ